MKEAAARDEELSKKKTFEEFKEQLETCEMETLAQMNEADKESKVTGKTIYVQEAMQVDFKDK